MFDDGYARLGRLLSLAAIPLTIGLIPGPALATCVNPTGTEGRLIYNSTSKVVQFCDGTNWIGMGGGGGGGGASALVGLSDVDAASAGTGNVLVYNAVSGNWEAASVGSDTEVIFNDGGALSGNASFVFDKTNIRVGVGTATPAQAIDVAGLVTSEGVLLKSVAGDPPTLAGAPYLGDLANVDTTSAADGLVLKYNGTSNQWEAASDAISGGGSSLWTQAGSDIYYNSGKVGIGTTAPGAPLHVSSANTFATDLRLGNTDTGGRQWTLKSLGSAGAGGAGMFKIDDSTAGASRLVIDTSGNVGIGTTAPNAPLHVAKTVSGASADVAMFANTVSGTSGTAARIYLSTHGAVERAVYIEGVNTSGSSNAHSLAFGVSAPSATPVERMRILSNGNVGIGTANPGALLEVMDGAMRVSRNGAQTQFIELVNNSASGGFIRGQSGENNKKPLFVEAVHDSSGSAAGILPIIFRTGPLSGPTEWMRITDAGNVGIGTANPAAKLDVNGSIVAGPMGSNGSWTNTQTGVHMASGGYVWLARANPSLYIQHLGGSGGVVNFASAQTYVGGISVNTSSVAYNTTSDYRLKENITPISQALDRVSALNPKRFNFRNDPDNVIDGFLAHEVQAVAPYAVTGEKDALDDAGEPIYQQVDYGKLTPLLAAAIKELKADNDNLRSEHDAEIRALRVELEALKSALDR